MLDKFKQSKLVQDVFVGIRPFVVGLILAACIDIFLTTLFDFSAIDILNKISWLHVLIFVIGLFIYEKFKIHPILVIVLGAILGILLGL